MRLVRLLIKPAVQNHFILYLKIYFNMYIQIGSMKAGSTKNMENEMRFTNCVLQLVTNLATTYQGTALLKLSTVSEMIMTKLYSIFS